MLSFVQSAVLRKIYLTGALLVVLAWLSGCASSDYSGRGAANPRVAGGFSTVIIDAGHGGKDQGGHGHGLTEKILTLDTALALRNELQARGMQVILTRSDDHFIELDDRVAFANRHRDGRTIFISVHYDASGSSAQGATAFYWRSDSHGLATRVEQALSSATGLHPVGVIRRRLRVTRNPNIPCMLVECGFMTNSSDAPRIAQSAFRKRIAVGIANGIAQQQHLGDLGIPPVPELHEPLSKGSDRRTY